MNEYEEKLSVARELLNNGRFSSCVRDCGALLEHALKELLHNLLLASKKLRRSQERRKFRDVETRLGEKKGETYEIFSLGKLIQLYAEAELWDVLRQELNATHAPCLNWKELNDWRNSVAHGRDANEDQACTMFIATKQFLNDCRFVGEHHMVGRIEGDAHKPHCAKCNYKLQQEWHFCPNCSVSLAGKCHACERPIEAGWRICPYCEGKLSPLSSLEAERAKKEYSNMCRGAWLDGVVNVRERQFLEEKRLDLGLSTAEAEAIEAGIAPPSALRYETLVQGVLIDEHVSDEERSFLDRKAREWGIDPWVANQIEEAVKAQMQWTAPTGRTTADAGATDMSARPRPN